MTLCSGRAGASLGINTHCVEDPVAKLLAAPDPTQRKPVVSLVFSTNPGLPKSNIMLEEKSPIFKAKGFMLKAFEREVFLEALTSSQKPKTHHLYSQAAKPKQSPSKAEGPRHEMKLLEVSPYVP